MRGISWWWLIDGALGGCGRPGGARGADVDLDTDLAALHERGVGAVLSLTETPLTIGALAAGWSPSTAWSARGGPAPCSPPT